MKSNLISLSGTFQQHFNFRLKQHFSIHHNLTFSHPVVFSIFHFHLPSTPILIFLFSFISTFFNSLSLAPHPTPHSKLRCLHFNLSHKKEILIFSCLPSFEIEIENCLLCIATTTVVILVPLTMLYHSLRWLYMPFERMYEYASGMGDINDWNYQRNDKWLWKWEGKIIVKFLLHTNDKFLFCISV